MSKKTDFNLAIIGCGHWGPNYIRCFKKNPQTTVTTVCDVNPANFSRAKDIDPTIKTLADYKQILSDPEIDAVVVATPASTHFPIVKDLLLAGKDVLAEKPLTLEPAECLELAELAKKQNRILMVGHTFLFNPGIRKLKECVDSGELGKIYYINATRTHLGLIRQDVDALCDLAPHDV